MVMNRHIVHLHADAGGPKTIKDTPPIAHTNREEVVSVYETVWRCGWKFQRQVNMFFSYGETGFAFFLPAGCVEERIIKYL